LDWCASWFAAPGAHPSRLVRKELTMQKKERAMNQAAPSRRTRRHVARSLVAGSAIALGLVAANTSIAQASTTAGDGAQTYTAQSSIQPQDGICHFPLCQPFQISG
jgi:ferric-dicitrate binding protein FerR (iron transport regulator)